MVAPARPPYRNDVVFRSAERLLASQPKKPPRRLPVRSLIFLLGLGCGLGSAFFWLRPAREAGAATDAAATAEATYPNRKRPTLRMAGAQPAFDVPARNVTTAATKTEAPAEAPDSGTTTSQRPARTGPRAVAQGTSPSPGIATSAPTTPATILTRFTPNLKLRGELRAVSGGVRPVEFELFLLPGRLGGLVQGFVQYFDGSRPGRIIGLSGIWVNRTLTLRETEKLPTNPPNGLSFVIEFPATDSSEKITGSWTYGATAGTLILTSTGSLPR